MIKLEGNWKVQEFTKNDEPIKILESGISFEQKSETIFAVTGNSGINSFFGDIEIIQNTISVGDKMASTKMAGSPEAMEYEDTFLECLTKADGIEILEQDGNETLKISSSQNNMSLYFISSPSDES